ncbi:hypothetical protein [Ehrlichia ruminantium]|uniref:hypothetical protein n=1 Tax=Ehrlichia ruminantium TaxID=779 RepID=UPI00130E7A1D
MASLGIMPFVSIFSFEITVKSLMAYTVIINVNAINKGKSIIDVVLNILYNLGIR